MVRWSWTLALALALTVPAFAEPTLRWSPSNPVIEVGQQVTLSVMLDDTLTVRTIELYIAYDASIVTTVSGGPGALFQGFNTFPGFVEVDPGHPGLWHGYCVILGAGDWATGPGELWTWTVQGTQEGICAITTSEVTLLPPGGGAYPETTLPGTTVAVGDFTAAPGDETGPCLTLRPNPFNPATTLSFGLGPGGRGRLDVLDLRGRRVATLWNGVAGEGSCTWNGRDEAGQALPSGVYTFSLISADGRATTVRGTLVR